MAYGVEVASKDGTNITVVSLKLKNNKGEVVDQKAVNGIVQGGKKGEFFMDGVKLVNDSIFPKVEGAAINVLSGSTYMKEGSKVSFTVTPEDETKLAKVMLGDEELTPDEDGVYTCKLYRDSEFTVTFVDKPAEPAGTNGQGGGGGNTVIIIVAAVAAVLVIGGSGAALALKKKKK